VTSKDIFDLDLITYSNVKFSALFISKVKNKGIHLKNATLTFIYAQGRSQGRIQGHHQIDPSKSCKFRLSHFFVQAHPYVLKGWDGWSETPGIYMYN